jgi:hypothetical protein
MAKWAAYGLILALGFPGAAVAENVPAAASSCEYPMNGEILKAQEAWRQGQPDKAATIMRAMIERPTFASLLFATQVHARMLYGVILSAFYHDHAAALVQLKTATELPCATGRSWQIRLQVAIDGGDRADAMRTVTVLADHWEDWLDGLDYWIVRLEADTPDTPALMQTRNDMMAALARVGWKPDPDLVAIKPPDLQ